MLLHVTCMRHHAQELCDHTISYALMWLDSPNLIYILLVTIHGLYDWKDAFTWLPKGFVESPP